MRSLAVWAAGALIVACSGRRLPPGTPPPEYEPPIVPAWTPPVPDAGLAPAAEPEAAPESPAPAAAPSSAGSPGLDAGAR